MEDFEENDEMAAMMGFSSFGGTKKRKFDQTRTSSKDEYSASGANSTELGVRTKVPEDDQASGDGHMSTPAAVKPTASAGGLASFLARGQALPEQPPTVMSTQEEGTSHETSSASELISFGGPSIPRSELNALRNGVRNADGDIAYFLPSFVEDPWERLLPGRT